MARRSKTKRPRKTKRKAKRKTRTQRAHRIKSRRLIKRPRALSNKQLQRGLRIMQELKDLFPAARAAGVTPQRFVQAALQKGAIRRKGKRWIVTGSLPRQMLFFSSGREVIVTVPGIKSASLVGKYMATVRQFLRTNKPDALAPFVDRSVKDTAGKSHPFETNPNAIYRLSLAGDQAFEQIYRIVI